MIQHVLGIEKAVGSDLGVMVPRCVMASNFRSPQDPTGEMVLRHWIKVGQIQDSLYPLVARL